MVSLFVFMVSSSARCARGASALRAQAEAEMVWLQTGGPDTGLRAAREPTRAAVPARALARERASTYVRGGALCVPALGRRHVRRMDQRCWQPRVRWSRQAPRSRLDATRGQQRRHHERYERSDGRLDRSARADGREVRRVLMKVMAACAGLGRTRRTSTRLVRVVLAAAAHHGPLREPGGVRSHPGPRQRHRGDQRHDARRACEVPEQGFA
jgi:hypothetical protein